MTHRIDDFDFDLPTELIAGEPLADRAASRMMTLFRSTASFDDRNFRELPTILSSTDILVLNNTKVFPARLLGRTETGGRVEIFLIEDLGGDGWAALARPARRLTPGKYVIFEGEDRAVITSRTESGGVTLRFETEEPVADVIDRIGRTPLPPYIKRDSDLPDADSERYQTVFAAERGAIAAPTAGLHFTDDVLDRLATRGVGRAEITLHVGYGTFEPVRVEQVSEHRVLPERYTISSQTAEFLNDAKASGKRVIAVGTTTTRCLEANFALGGGQFTAARAMADLTILPGYEFRAVDGLLTNFHLPKSSLLILVSTFAGHELIMKAYRSAIASRYRFYSYGDCMLIL